MMLRQRTVYKDKVIHVRVTDHPRTWAIRVRPAANLIPISDDGRILMQHEYRRALKAWTWAFPGGMIEDGETASRAANREC